MFKNIQATINELNNGIKDTVNTQKAKALKKKLFSIGLPMTIVGFLGAFTCFILFATAGFDAFGENGFTARIIVPFVLFIPCGVVGGFGAMILSMAVKISLTRVATGLVSEGLSVKCPNCNTPLAPDVLFCTKCGSKIKNVCPNCNHENALDSEFCAKCGTKL